MRKRIFVTTQFEGFHAWEDAPPEHKYLRSLHRHMFHVRVEKEVREEDREIEFIDFKREVKECIQVLRSSCEEKVIRWSCETWARVLLERFSADKVEVSEDGENGAIVEK